MARVDIEGTAADFTMSGRKGGNPIDKIARDDSFRAFRNVVQSLMRDASQVVVDADVSSDPGELRERLDLVGHYISYTLRYCTECPLIKSEPEEYGSFKTIQFPGAS